MSESGGNSLDKLTARTKIQGDADDVRRMMLILISGAISNSNAVIRQEFRKLRFQMIDDTEGASTATSQKYGPFIVTTL